MDQPERAAADIEHAQAAKIVPRFAEMREFFPPVFRDIERSAPGQALPAKPEFPFEALCRAPSGCRATHEAYYDS